MAAICHCVFKKDENKTNEVSNYIGNKLAHITLQKTNIEVITNWGKKKIYKWLIYQTSLTLPPVIKVPNASQNHRLYIYIYIWGGSLFLRFFNWVSWHKVYI